MKANTADESVRTEEAEHADDEDRAAAASKLPIEQAIDASVPHTPGAVDDAAWDDDDQGAWEVEIISNSDNREIELRVDPATGDVTPTS
ncbi:PepSY domain-containing protein [Janibacter sp. UYMM211]|uniref:PepSY domain-containing protein n=1 Tax=Janibacter sp. UYMM211 TaxID=3156342 RepID=UPI003394A8BA